MKFFETYPIFEIKLQYLTDQKAFDYIKRIYKIFKDMNQEWVSRNDLKLTELSKSLKLKATLQTFLIKKELIRKGHFFKLKFGDKEPTFRDVQEYMEDYRKSENISKNIEYKKLTPDRKLELNQRKYQNMKSKLEPGEKLDTNKWYKNLSDEDKELFLQKKRNNRK